MHTMSSSAAPPPPSDWPWGVFPLFIVAVWIFVSFLISNCGWSRFADRYGALERPAGRSFGAPSAHFGFVFGSYRNVVRVIPTDRGLYFYTIFLFRAFHRPFILPWTSIRSITEAKSLFILRLRIKIEDEAGSIQMWLPSSFAEALQRFPDAPCVPSGA